MLQLKNMIINRKIIANIWENIDNDKIFLLNGARQVGKTKILTILKERLITERHTPENYIFWFDLEKTEHLELWSSQASAIASLPSDNINKYYIFIDEFQKSKSIGSILKVLHDHHPNFKIIITGSATWYLNIDESLAGRKELFPVWPLSFEECLTAGDTDIIKYYANAHGNIASAVPSIINKINISFLNYLTFGGYPSAVLASEADKTKVLSELLDSYLTRDIQLWQYKANTLQVKKVLTLLASQIGSLLEVSRLSNNADLGRTSLINRLELLQNTFILTLLKPFHTNKIKEITKNPKIFLLDLGLRNMLMENFSVIPQTPNFGQLAENFVATELMRNLKPEEILYYWRTISGQEVDFIIKKNDRLTPVEVKSGNEDSVPTGLINFIKQYSPKTAYVLNWTIIKEVQVGNTTILFRPLWWKI